jgi:hypothetical protein
MKISKIFATCVFAATFVSSANAFANDSNFYSGEYVCDGKVKFTDWELSKLNDREYSAVIYHGTRGENQYMEYKLDGVVEDDKLNIFYNKRPFIVARLMDADTEIAAQWVDSQGKPKTSCADFTVLKVEGAKERWDRTLEILASASPTVEQASQAADLQRALPPVQLLPELDQNAYESRYNESYRSFWSAYLKNEWARLQTLPVGTEEERKNLIAEMRLATGFNMSPRGNLANDDKARSQAANFLRLVSDRLSATETPVTAYDLDDANTCQRFTFMRYPSTADLELIVGLPVDYWDRTFTESVLAKAKSCQGANGIIQEIKSNYSEYESRRNAYSWAQGELKRLQAVPMTLTAFRDSNWLAVDTSAGERSGAGSPAIKRFLANVPQYRANRVDLALKEIEDSFKSHDLRTLSFEQANMFCGEQLGDLTRRDETLNKLFEGCDVTVASYVKSQERNLIDAQISAINSAPRNLAGLTAYKWFAINADVAEGWQPSRDAFELFEQGTSEALREALASAKLEIDTTFNEATPGDANEQKAVAMCESISSVSGARMYELISACNNGQEALAKKAVELKCEQVIKDSALDASLLSASIEQNGLVDNTVAIKELICAADTRDLKLTFPTSGSLFWKKQGIEIKTDPSVGNAWRLSAELETTDKDGVLKLTNVNRVGSPSLPSEDKILGCIAGKRGC